MKQTLFLALLALLTLGATCDDHKPDPKIPTDSELCPEACDNLRKLGCEEGDDLVDGETGMVVPCEIFCLDTQANGHALNPTCVATITDCNQLEPQCMEK